MADTRRIAFLFVLAIILLCGCRSTTGTDHDQIVKASIDLADSYTRLSRYEDALNVYDRALEQAEDYRLYYNKAITLSYLGRNDEAAELCAWGFDNYPHIIAFKTAQAFYLRLAGEKSLSREAYLQALELNPYDRDTRTRLIEDLIQDGETQLA